MHGFAFRFGGLSAPRLAPEVSNVDGADKSGESGLFNESVPTPPIEAIGFCVSGTVPVRRFLIAQWIVRKETAGGLRLSATCLCQKKTKI
jgi:hypothetical protein